MNVQSNVLSRYSEAAKQKSADLCCPIDYDTDLLKILPQEIIDKDYGCGDPSRYVKPGDTVLDLGSGGGKICYMAAQISGKQGKIIGVDMNDNMLALARKYQGEIAEKMGYDGVEFRKGYIQNLALDLDAVEKHLSENPITNLSDQKKFQAWQASQQRDNPLIANDSIDLVISNCVLNLVTDAEKKQLIDEIFRVVKPGGRIAISDIVSDKPVPGALKQDETLWSGCISGAFQERTFLDTVTAAGFIGTRYDQWGEDPWQVVEGIEFRSVTLTAYKSEAPKSDNPGYSIIYRGPYSRIHDDQGHDFPRGIRVEVSELTYRLLTEKPEYKNDFIGLTSPNGSLKPISQSKSENHTTDSCCTPKSCC